MDNLINNKILEDIKAYCKLNDISDFKSVLNKAILRGFTIIKFGDSPQIGKKKESALNIDLKRKYDDLLIEYNKVKKELVDCMNNNQKNNGELKRDIYGE